MEQEVIADIARRVQKMGRYTETAELMAKSMLEKGYSPNKIAAEVFKILEADEAYRKAVEENTLEYKKEIKELIEHTVEEAKEKGDRLIAHAGTMSWNDDLSMWEEHGKSLTGPNTLSQLIEAFQQQTAGELKNLTRSTGFVHTVLGKTGVLQAFQREMDLAVIKIASGVFSYSGNNKKYESLEKGTGYGTPTGLKGVNCTHNFYPYWEGDYIPPDIEYDETVYRNTQKQRAREREIRATRREIEAQNAVGGDVTELKAKLKKQRADYYAFSEKVGIRPKDNRLRVVAGTSDLKKDSSKALGKINKKKRKKDSSAKTDTIKSQSSAKKAELNKNIIKKNTAKELDNMSLTDLQKLTEKTAIEYYKSGISGINFGDRNVEDVAKQLAKQGSKTSLKKDILSMQKKMDNISFENIDKSSTISLTDKDIKTIHDYMSAKSYVINEKLRTGMPFTDDEKRFVDNLNATLDKMPKYEGNLQRSLYFRTEEDVKEFMKKHQDGSSVTYNEFLSTTKGEIYNPDGQIQIYIQNTKKGRDISVINESEKEVLYERNATFRVINVVKRDGKYYLLMEEEDA